jgi:polysaccharide export outer membrane protein
MPVRAWMAAAVIQLLQLVAIGCVAERPFVWVSDLPPAAAEAQAQALIGVHDTIVVVVQNQPTLSGEFVVRDDGAYLQPMLGTTPVEGRAAGQIAAYLQGRLKDLVVNPQVSVSIARVAPVRVSVIGEVKTPGSYELSRDRGVIPALAAAGWLTDFAARDRVFVVRAGTDQPRIRFRVSELTAADAHAARFRLRDGDVVVVE